MAEIEYLTVPHLSTKDLVRIFSKVSIDPAISWNGTPCWVWTGALVRGYSHVWCPQTNKHERAHCVMYAWLVGPIPRRVKGQKTPNLDHLCRNKPCINPVHLELVPPRINSLRGDTVAAENAQKTHCPQGHPFDRVKPDGERYCNKCARFQGQKQREANPEQQRQWVREYRARNIETIRAKDREAQRKRRARLKELI
jgi:hypothetical protein